MRRPTTDPPERVLAVDDREENLVALEALLRQQGIVVDRARSVPDALELLLRHDYAVALVDVQLPERSGFELARLMRGAERTKHVPIIFVTAEDGGPAAVAEGYASGAVDVLFKPVEPLVLQGKVRVFLELYRQKRELAQTARTRDALNEELRDAMDEVARSSGLLDSVFEAAPVGLAFLDRDLRFQRVNGALAAMNGLSPAAHLGKRVIELLPTLPSEEIEQIEATWRRVIETGEPVLDWELTGETPGTRGERRTWREAFYPVRARGGVIGVGLIVRDVTLEKRAEELQRFLVGIVGHDLRNPLSALTTTLDLLTRGGSLSERQLTLTGRMRNATRRMTRLIDDLLDYTSMRGGGGIPIDPRPLHVSEVIEPVVEELRTANPGRAIDVRGSGDGAGEWDPERLRQVVSNLVGNAVKYGDPARPIEVTWRDAGGEVIIEVRNQGEPIPPSALPTLFEPLAQLSDKGRRRSGIGLGLFIARQLVQAHGGSVYARSGEDATVFIVELPRIAARPDDRQASGAPPA